MNEDYTDLQLEKASFELGWFRENNIINEIKASKKLIRLLQSKEIRVDHCIGRKWFNDWIDDGIKKSHQHIASLSEDLNKLLIKRIAKL
jgi:hypothetical protein